VRADLIDAVTVPREGMRGPDHDKHRPRQQHR